MKIRAGAYFTPVTRCFLLPIWKFDIQRIFVQKGEALKTFLKNTKRYHYTLIETERIGVRIYVIKVCPKMLEY